MTRSHTNTIEQVTHTQLSSVLEDFFFRPLGLQHTWLVGYPEPQASSSVTPADVFYNINADV